MCKIDRLQAIDFPKSEFPSLPVGRYFCLNRILAGTEGTFKADILPVKDSENTLVRKYKRVGFCLLNPLFRK